MRRACLLLGGNLVDPSCDHLSKATQIVLIEILHVDTLGSQNSLKHKVNSLMLSSLTLLAGIVLCVVTQGPGVDLPIEGGRGDNWIGWVPRDISGGGFLDT